MDTHCLPSSSSLFLTGHKLRKLGPSYSWTGDHHQHNTTIWFFKLRIHSHACQEEQNPWLTRNPSVRKANRSVAESRRKEPLKESKKKGTVSGASALIIGTSIGTGILALPQKAAPAGLIPSSVSVIVCWGFLLIEALLLVEINVGLRRKKGKIESEEENELQIISIRTMAEETLGEWGGNLATAAYLFLGYTSMVAYCSKSGEILFHLINLPASVSGFFFTSLFTILISIGGTRSTDQVNQWLTASMLCLLLAVEVLGLVFEGWSGLEGISTGDWGKVPDTIPVIIFSLVYHDLAPVICAYLGSDLRRIRVSVLLGSLVPLIALLLWDAITLSLSSQADQAVDPVELLKSVDWGLPLMVEAFSLLAVGTSLIGTLLSFSQFFKEQLDNLSWNSPSTQTLQKPDKLSVPGKWWRRNKISFTAMAMVVAPTLFVSSAVPDAFSAATDIAGGYCMTILYGVLPPAMAWAMHHRESEDTNHKALSRTRPALLVVGLFACGIVMEQIFQDLPLLHTW